MKLRDRIKPCPFCGSRAPYFYHAFRIECARCGCGQNSPEAYNETEAIEWWNAVPRLPAAKLEVLRAQWTARMKDARKRAARERAERERLYAAAKAKDPSLNGEYRKWTREREAWLSAPVDGVSND